MKGTVNAPCGGGNNNIDAQPTQNSGNAVSSGGVYAALQNKQDALSYDQAPTSGSQKLIKSGDLYTAFNGKQDKLPVPTAQDNGKILGVANAAYALLGGGAAGFSLVSVLRRELLTHSGVGSYWTVPANIDSSKPLKATLIGGGGGGGDGKGARMTSTPYSWYGAAGGGGGSGFMTEATINNPAAGTTYNFTIGAGGAPRMNGGTTSFGTYSAGGGDPGGSGTAEESTSASVTRGGFGGKGGNGGVGGGGGSCDSGSDSTRGSGGQGADPSANGSAGTKGGNGGKGGDGRVYYGINGNDGKRGGQTIEIFQANGTTVTSMIIYGAGGGGGGYGDLNSGAGGRGGDGGMHVNKSGPQEYTEGEPGNPGCIELEYYVYEAVPNVV